MTRDPRENGDSALRVVAVAGPEDVLEEYRGTPIERLLLAQNCARAFEVLEAPTLMVVTCTDSRVRLRLPPGAACELRSAGVHLGKDGMFQISFAVSVAGVRHLALVSHDDCSMSRLADVRDAFTTGLRENTDWTARMAERYFTEHLPVWRQEDPMGAVTEHARKLRDLFPALTVAPLHYTVTDGRLHQLRGEITR